MFSNQFSAPKGRSPECVQEPDLVGRRQGNEKAVQFIYANVRSSPQNVVISGPLLSEACLRRLN